MLLGLGARFWWLVQAGAPPQVDGSSATRDAIKSRYRASQAGERTEIELGAFERARVLQAEIKARESELDTIKCQIQEAMGEAEFGTVEGRDVVSWKSGTAPIMTKTGERQTRRFLFLKS